MDMEAEMKQAWEKFNALPHTPVVVLALYYWGEGATLEEAMKNMRKAGFRGKPSKKNKVKVYKFPDTVKFDGVDSMGGVSWRVRPDLCMTPEQPEPERSWL